MAEPLPPLTDAEVVELAREIVTNVVYVAPDKRAAECSFGMLFALMREDQIPPNLWLVYERWDKAGPRALNGYPIFTSCKFVAEESREALVAEVTRMEAALAGSGEHV